MQNRVTIATTATRTQGLTSWRGQRLRALVVDREKGIRDIVLPWLFADGFDCREAEDGRDALDLLASGLRIDLVASCLMMPVVDGLSLLVHIKKYHPRIPFVIATAIDDKSIRGQAIQDGVDGYLQKPFTRDEFITLVRRAIASPPRPIP